MNLIYTILFALGYGVIALIGTRDQMVFQWPGYLLLGAMGVLTVAAARGNHGARRVGVGHICLLTALVFSCYVLGRAWFSPVGYFARVESFLLLSALLCYLLFACLLYRTRFRALALGVLSLLLVGNVLVGFYHLVNDPTFTILPGYSRSKPVGAGGFYNNYNHLGGFLELVTPFLLSLCLFGKMPPGWRIVVGFVSLLGVAGVAMTASRGTYLSFTCAMLVLAGLGLYLVKGLAPLRFKRVLVGTLVAGLVLGLPAAFFASKSLDRRFRGASAETQMASGVSVRQNSWNLAVEQWKLSPVLGTGSRTYDQNSIRLWPRHVSREHGHPEFAHNDYLQLLAEYGLIGLGLGLLFLLAHLLAGLSAVRWYRQKGSSRLFSNRLAFCVGALSAAAAYSVHSFADFNLHLPANAIPFAFAMAVLANPGFDRRGRATLTVPGLIPAVRVAMPAIGLFFLACWKMAPGEYFLEKARRVDINETTEYVIEQAERSLQYDRRNPVTYRLLGTARMLHAAREQAETGGGDFGPAVEALQAGLELMPHDLFSLVGLARCYLGMVQFAKAKEVLREAQEWGPFEVDPHLWYGHVLMEQGLWQSEVGDTDGAIELITRAVPSFERAYAVQPFQESRVWKDSYIEAMKVLAALYELRANRLFSEGVAAREAGELRPALSKLHDTYESYQKAIAYNREAAGNPPGFVASEHLMKAHEVSGQLLVELKREHPAIADELGL